MSNKRDFNILSYRVVAALVFSFLTILSHEALCQPHYPLNLPVYPMILEKDMFRQITRGHYKKISAGSVHPVSTSAYAISMHHEYLSTQSEAYKMEFLEACDALLRSMVVFKSDGGDEIGLWYYNFDWDYFGTTIKKPWLSGMAQGMVISVMLRAYEVTHLSKYFDAAQKGFNTFVLKSPFREQIVFEDDHEMFIQEYPPVHKVEGKVIPSHVLNGGLVGLWGLLEFAECTNSPILGELREKSFRFLATRLKEYDIDEIGPAYSLLPRANFPQFINFETDVSSPSESLPVYSITLTDDKERLLGEFRTTGGCAGYEFKEFTEATKLDLFFSTDKRYPDDKVPIRSIRLVTEDDKTVGSMLMDGGEFYGSWGKPRRIKNEAIVRDYIPSGDGYVSPSLAGRFIIKVNTKVRRDSALFLEVEYLDLTKVPVILHINQNCKIDLGFLRNKGDGRWKKQRIYIPRARDFEAYNLYMNWGNVERIEGRMTQSLDLAKYLEKWGGSWIKWHPPPIIMNRLASSKYITMDLVYRDISDVTVFLNVFAGVNYTVSLLDNKNTGRWRTVRFTIPSHYFNKDGAHPEKTSTVVNFLSAIVKKYNGAYPNLRAAAKYLAKWKNESIFTMEKHTFLLYTKDDDVQVSIKLARIGSKDQDVGEMKYSQFSVPSYSKKKWGGDDARHPTLLMLGKYDFSIIQFPYVRGVVKYEIKVNYSDTPKKGTLYVAFKSLKRTELWKIKEIVFRGSGKAKTELVFFNTLSFDPLPKGKSKGTVP
jgi:hypothetical protein